MKKISQSLFLLAFLGFFSPLFAQGSFSFVEEVHDFGKIKEGVMAEYKFVFTNKGDQPIVISRVQASCGCTTPEWSKEPILRGQTGEIKVVYNSKGRPGAFNKSIHIYSNAAEPDKTIFIKGEVEKDPDALSANAANTVIDPTQPNMNLSQSVYNFGKLMVGQKVSHKFEFTNTGKTPLSVHSIQSPCGCVTAKSLPTDIAPGASAILELIYAPTAEKTSGEVVTIRTNNKNMPTTKVSLQGQVVKSVQGGNMLIEQKKPTSPF